MIGDLVSRNDNGHSKKRRDQYDKSETTESVTKAAWCAPDSENRPVDGSARK